MNVQNVWLYVNIGYCTFSFNKQKIENNFEQQSLILNPVTENVYS